MTDGGSGGGSRLGAAIALERAGVEPIVIERAPEFREAGFGLVVSANAVTALRSLGLSEGVAARGTRVRRAEIRNPRGVWVPETQIWVVGDRHGRWSTDRAVTQPGKT